MKDIIEMVPVEDGDDVEGGIKVPNGDVDASVTYVTPSSVLDDSTSDGDQSLVYKISDRPPVHLTLFFGVQQAVLSIAHQLVISLLVAEVVCASNDSQVRAQLLGSTLFMTGLTTLLMVTVGVRLPLFQGAAVEYLAPLMALGTVDSTFCVAASKFDTASNVTANVTDYDRDHILNAITSLQGSLMVAGAVHTFVGATGLVGIMLRFIGPVTIVPTVLLIGLYMIRATAKFVVINWGVALITASVTIILSLYLGRKKTPFPLWTRRRGFRIVWYPFHQVFAILIGMVAGYITCAIITVTNAVPFDPSDPHFRTRIDARADVIHSAQWFHFPYPGQFGAIQFSSSALVGCLLATVLSILDSVGDYFACAKTCRVPPPPRHAVNRGLTVEGLCTFLSGAVGCGHATTTYAGNIGAMGLTKVASRWVFVTVGVMYMCFGLLGKVSAIFITIPEPVLGGALITITGVFIGVILSNLNEISLISSRNLSIIGISLLVGVMVPYYIQEYPDDIKTDNMTLDNFLKMFFGNANFAGAACAFFMDNTVPGTKEERGILNWYQPHKRTSKNVRYLESADVYLPWMPEEVRKSKWLKFIPFLPEPEVSVDNTSTDADNDVL